MYKRMTEVVSRNRTFIIVKDTCLDMYLAVEDKYITDGKLNTELNGFQTNASKDMRTCVDTTLSIVEIEYLVEQGLSKAQAFAKVYDLEDQMEAVEKMFK